MRHRATRENRSRRQRPLLKYHAADRFERTTSVWQRTGFPTACRLSAKVTGTAVTPPFTVPSFDHRKYRGSGFAFIDEVSDTFR